MKIAALIFTFFPLVVLGQIKGEKALEDSLSALKNRLIRQGEINRGREYTDSNLVNGTGILMKYGTMIDGYMINYFDTTRFGKLTVIEEYAHNKKNGRRIQFFNYPTDTASVETYSMDTLDGFFYSNHLNGKRKAKGIYKKGKISDVQYWDKEGNEIEKDNRIRSKNGLFYLDEEVCNGRRTFYRCNDKTCTDLLAEFYFSEGIIDSVTLYKSYGYWGKPLMEIRINYLDSTRTYISYHGPSGFIHWINQFKILTVNPIKQINSEHDSFGIDNDTYVRSGMQTGYYDQTNIISDQGYYENDVLVGAWKSYDQMGRLIESEQK